MYEDDKVDGYGRPIKSSAPQSKPTSIFPSGKRRGRPPKTKPDPILATTPKQNLETLQEISPEAANYMGRQVSASVFPTPAEVYRKKVADLDDLLRIAISDEERIEILHVLKNRAIGGDMQALKLVLAYLFGNPIERVQHSGPDGNEIPINISVKLKQAYGDRSRIPD